MLPKNAKFVNLLDFTPKLLYNYVTNFKQHNIPKGGIDMSKKGNICVIMADITEDYRDEYLMGVAKQAERMDYVTTVFSMSLLNQLKTCGEEAVFDLIDYDRYDGVVFLEKTFSSQKSLGKRLARDIAEKCSKPVVVIGNSTVFSNTVTGDFSRNIEQLTDHIIEQHGCELLYFLGGYQGVATRTDIGFTNSLTKHGISVTDDNMIYGGFWRECADKLAEDIAYGVVEKPDAVICYSDYIAFFFIKALSRYGIRVPDDIIVAGFSASSCSQNGIISITTCACDAEYIGRTAVARLHSLITGEDELQINRPRVNIITGMSCGCGNNQHIDLRMRLEMHEKRSVEDNQFTNSELVEKLFACRDIKDLSDVISQTHYLISDKNCITVCLHTDEHTSRCLFMTDFVNKEDQIDFKSTDIFPIDFPQAEHPTIVHVLPIVFDGKDIGHIAVGYNKPTVYNLHLKNYAKHLAMGMEVIGIRTAAVPTPTAVTEITENVRRNKTLLAYNGETMNRINIDSVLYFETEGRKTVAVLHSGRYVVRSPLAHIEEQYQDIGFLRVSKSTILNLAKVKKYAPDNDRTMLATLVGDIKIRVSRKCAPEFKSRMSGK